MQQRPVGVLDRADVRPPSREAPAPRDGFGAPAGNERAGEHTVRPTRPERILPLGRQVGGHPAHSRRQRRVPGRRRAARTDAGDVADQVGEGAAAAAPLGRHEVPRKPRRPNRLDHLGAEDPTLVRRFRVRRGEGLHPFRRARGDGSGCHASARNGVVTTARTRAGMRPADGMRCLARSSEYVPSRLGGTAVGRVTVGNLRRRGRFELRRSDAAASRSTFARCQVDAPDRTVDLNQC